MEIRFGEVKPRQGFYLPSLDVLRFGAFLMVFVSHSMLDDQALPNIMKAAHLSPFLIRCVNKLGLCGNFGVDVFFCLSAYLIIEILLREQRRTGTVNIGNFYKRRILRIWPLYFAFLLFIWWIAPLFLAGEHTPTLEKFGFLFFAGNWVFVFGSTRSACIILWSVSIEEQFYLICPWVLRRFARRLDVVCAGLLLMATSYRLILVLSRARYGIFWASTFSRVDAIACGALVAFMLKGRIPDLSRLARAALLIASAVVMVAAVSFGSSFGRPALLTYPLVAASCAGFLVAFLHFQCPPATFIGRALVHLGRISYGLYVFHAFALHLCTQRIHISGQFQEWLLRSSAAFLLTVVLAMLSYRYLEMPFLRLKDRFSFVTLHLPETAVSNTACAGQG